MNKEELKFLMSRGFTVSELLEIEGAGSPQPEPAPQPETKLSETDSEKPETAPKTPEEPVSVSKPDNEQDPSAAKIAALEAQVEQLQAQLLRLGTFQPGPKEEKMEDLVAAF